MENKEITTLIRKSQNGDAEAMEELLHAAYTPVSYQCRRFLKTGADAEDMTQEILLLIYTKIDTLHEPAAFWGWLGRMTANRCKNALTRTHEDLPILEDDEGNSVLDSMENEDRQTVPEEAFDNAETARMIGGIIDALPEAQRNCVLLYYYDEMSVKEIADMVGTSENTVKSRLNYARKTIKENVLDYEKKQGIRLHSLAPIPLLLYFLRMDAEESVDSGKAAQAVSKAMEQGALAAHISGAAHAAAKNAVSHTLKGFSVKTAAIAGAGLLLTGGAAAGIATAINHKTAENSIHVEAEDSLETAEQEPEEMDNPMEETVEAQEDVLFPAEMLSLLPYTGDAGQCAMTMGQAEAFASALDFCLSESRTAGYPEPPFCQAALFDAGEGIPALFVVWGQDMGYDNVTGYMPNISRVYCWDGTAAKEVFASSPAEGAVFSEDTSNTVLTPESLLINRWSASGGVCTDSTAVYALPEDLYTGTPGHTYEEFVFRSAEIPTDSEVQAAIMGSGSLGDGYSFSTLSPDKWEHYPEYGEYGGRWAEDGGWLAAALDGEFLSPEEAKAARKTMAWYETEWTLGHGAKWNTDVSHFWTGNWMDAEELAALLRGSDITENGSTMTEQEEPAGNPDSRIRRTGFDTGGRSLEIFYEMPVFGESGAGYQEINRFFEEKQDAFLDPEGDEIAWALEMADENPPADGDIYRYTVSAEIMQETGKYASVSQSLNSYLGGIREEEITYYNFRTDTGALLSLMDLVDGTQEEIGAAAADALAVAYPFLETNYPEALDMARGYDFESCRFYISGGQIYLSFTTAEIYGIAYGPSPPVAVRLPIPLKAEWE
ncbi:MAG: sigma-70 family RNA polymerase sigma factor [Lachnospiraceae bacterium]|nr:sigma-70 family RNA polymerase sigma factor [Lachnospiraceae bacterium]